VKAREKGSGIPASCNQTTVEDTLQGVSKLRNRVIARVFRELDLIEQWGSGVSRMFKEAKALGLPEPEIIEVGMRVRFIVYLAESIAVLPESKEIKGILDIPEHQVSELGARTGTMWNFAGTKLKYSKNVKMNALLSI